MAVRTGHGNGAGSPRVEALPPDQLPAATPDGPVRPDRDALGRFVPSKAAGVAKRTKPGVRGALGLVADGLPGLVALLARALRLLEPRGLPRQPGLGLPVRDFDLRLGTVNLEENNTGDPLRGAGPDDHMFVDEGGALLTSDHRLAEVLRESL